MKGIIFLIMALAGVPSIFAQSSTFTLTGDISNLKAPVEWVFISYSAHNQHITDSVQVKQDGKTKIIAVQTGISTLNETEIVRGLNESSQVILPAR